MYKIEISSSRRTEFLDITSSISQTVNRFSLSDGMLYIFSPHTTGGVTINEGADPAVKRDILHVLDMIIPWNADYQHLEGNSAAHIKTSLVGSGVHVALENGRLCLGTWQKIFFCEFDGPRNRNVWLKNY